jgi:hypothetical protein
MQGTVALWTCTWATASLLFIRQLMTLSCDMEFVDVS